MELDLSASVTNHSETFSELHMVPLALARSVSFAVVLFEIET